MSCCDVLPLGLDTEVRSELELRFKWRSVIRFVPWKYTPLPNHFYYTAFILVRAMFPIITLTILEARGEEQRYTLLQ